MEKNQEIFWRIIAALTIISGAGLMLLNLNTESLWVDEGYTLAVSQVTISKLITPFDVHPPLFYVIEKIFSIIEKSEYAIRLPSAIASILFIILINIYAKKQFSPQGTFITTLYLALSFTLLVYSVNARNYTFLLLAFSTACLSLVTLTNTVITQKQPPPRKTKTLLAIYVTSSIICLYTHNAANVLAAS